jgi:hypothetical protein
VGACCAKKRVAIPGVARRPEKALAESTRSAVHCTRIILGPPYSYLMLDYTGSVDRLLAWPVLRRKRACAFDPRCGPHHHFPLAVTRPGTRMSVTGKQKSQRAKFACVSVKSVGPVQHAQTTLAASARARLTRAHGAGGPRIAGDGPSAGGFGACFGPECAGDPALTVPRRRLSQKFLWKPEKETRIFN